jgi:Tfp pilus assembly protein PilF
MPERNHEARTSFEGALEIDPNHAEASAGIAETY